MSTDGHSAGDILGVGGTSDSVSGSRVAFGVSMQENAAQNQTDVKSVKGTTSSSISSADERLHQGDTDGVKEGASLQTKQYKHPTTKNRSQNRQLKSFVASDVIQQIASPSLRQLYSTKTKGTGKYKRTSDMSENSAEAEGSTATKTESNELNGTPSVDASIENAEDVKAPKPKTKKVVLSRKHSNQHDSKRSSKSKEKWGLLLPYLDNPELTGSSAQPSEIHYEYKSRITANQIVEPHISFKMDHILPNLYTKETESWHKKPSPKMSNIYSAKHTSFPSGPKVKGKRPRRLKRKKHSFDEENKHDYFETRRIFFHLHLDVLKSQKALYQTTMKTVLLFYMGMSKGSATAIKELTDYYCH